MTLRIDDLSVRFPTVPALRNISFTLGRGEIIGLTGTSGAGKSLVAEALVGALPCDAIQTGHITLNGAPVAPGTIALAPQRLDALDPLAPVGRQIQRLARLANRAVDVPDTLANVGLPAETARFYPHELSGGMARRVLLATALATGAPWIVADEPTVGLDDAAAARVLSLLADLAEAGQGIIVISHDLIGLARIASHIVILREGRHIETAPKDAFIGTGSLLRTAFAQRLWAAQLEADVPC